jgi:nitric oxide reductase subunit C
MPVAPPSPNAASGVARATDRPQVFNQLCIACHSLDGQGGNVGPALDLLGDRRDAAYVKTWLEDPAAVKPDTKMPKLPLTEGQITELTAFLSQLKKEKP